ncbi:hypothetical protein [Amycolatopsis suaedae]|uniref:Uncharacterized protein n=1 Tax=Amycolatopsis suaedae TaxID=2510978 RepID=A0A4Q7JCU9_9PSEU|nr:hypothetical protein [Amycolatopsis suaedae]RZQ64154.1 hypothetical protein EWH70_09160 [Amycolatopsis suaedae]
MDHGTHSSLGPAGADLVVVLVRLALLLTAAAVAGTGLLRPVAGDVGSTARLTGAGLAGISAVLALLSITAWDVNPVAGAGHAVLVIAVAVAVWLPGAHRAARWLAVPLILLLVVETAAGRSGVDFAVDTVYVAAAATWFGAVILPRRWESATLRPGPLAITLAGLLVVAGVVRLVASGVGFDRRLYDSAFGLVLTASVVLPIVVLVLTIRGLGYQTGGIVVAAAFLAWTALAAVPVPGPLPEPGVPVLAEAAGVPVLISPHRPGTNLVHLPAAAGQDAEVSVGDGPARRAVPRLGAEGTWAEVELPEGRGELTVRSGGRNGTVDVDTGSGTGPASASGVDGPECASAALGALVAERREVLGACPADALSDEDADALRQLVGFLDERGVAGVAVAADASPRGTRAAEVVRDAAAAHGLRADSGPGADNALVAVGGWAAAQTALTEAADVQRDSASYPFGLYLAPWLLHGPVVNSVTSSAVPLRFDPREQLAVTYAVAVGNAFGEESPTPAGFHTWLGPQRHAASGPVRVFAAAQVTAMPMGPDEVHVPGMPMNTELAGQWVPRATVVPVSAPLPVPRRVEGR